MQTKCAKHGTLIVLVSCRFLHLLLLLETQLSLDSLRGTPWTITIINVYHACSNILIQVRGCTFKHILLIMIRTGLAAKTWTLKSM